MSGLNLKKLKEECKEEMFVYSEVCLKLIEIIEQQEEELDAWREEGMI